MKVVLVLGLLALICGAVLPDELSDYLDVITKPDHFCSSVCVKNNVSCLPRWMHPRSTHPHCTRQQEDVCDMCLLLVGIFPGQVSCQDEVTDENQTPTCTGPCSTVCSFKEMCLPAREYPNAKFNPHCKGKDGENYPTQGCVECLIKNGLMTDLTNETTTARPVPETTVQTWSPPANPVTFSTTTSLKCSPPPSTPDLCLPFCDYYKQICMPSEVDPCFYFYPHCDTAVQGYRQASVQCLQCINIHGLRPNSWTTSTSPATTSTLPATKSISRATKSTSPAPSLSSPVTLPWDCSCTRVQTKVAEARTGRCPKKGSECDLSANREVSSFEDWSCSCGSRTEDKKVIAPRTLFGNCLFIFQGNCICRRTTKTVRRAKIKKCKGFNNNHWKCNLGDPSATEETTFYNYCSCNGCSWLPF